MALVKVIFYSLKDVQVPINEGSIVKTDQSNGYVVTPPFARICQPNLQRMDLTTQIYVLKLIDEIEPQNYSFGQ